MRILVTGSTGIIGSRLTDRLKKEGHEVLGTDRNRAGEEDVIKTDISFPEEVHRMYAGFPPELTIHMAGEVGRLNGEEYPERMLRTNILGTLNVAKACLEFRSKLISFSTSEVYGISFMEKEAKETDELPALGQTNIYSLSKMAGEGVIKHYVDNYKLRAVTVRPFMLYTAGERPNPFRSAMTNWCWAALNGKPLTVHKGTIRAWCYADDLFDGLELLFDSRMEKWESYNIGNENYTTAEESASLVCEIAGVSKSLMSIVEPPKAFISPIKKASIAKIKALGYEPKVTLKEGIKKVLDWQRSLLVGTSNTR